MRPQKHIILYPGSFNPIHKGHLAVAETALQDTGSDALWFVVSPRNPFKEKDELASEENRLEMVKLAIETSNRKEQLKACDIEFTMPKPSFTVNMLRKVSAANPDHVFSLLIGSDNVDAFNRWKEYNYILDHYPVLVYPREGHMPQNKELIERLTFLDGVRLMPQAATAIRNDIKGGNIGKDNNPELLPEPVWNYIQKHRLYGCSHQFAGSH